LLWHLLGILLWHLLGRLLRHLLRSVRLWRRCPLSWRDRRLCILHLLRSLLIAGIRDWVCKLDLLKETSSRLRRLSLVSLVLNRLLLVEIGHLLRLLASVAGISKLRLLLLCVLHRRLNTLGSILRLLDPRLRALHLRLGLEGLLGVLMVCRRALDLRLGLLWCVLMLRSGTLDLVLVRCPERHPLHAGDYTLGRRSRRARARSRHAVGTCVEMLIGLAGLNTVLLLNNATTTLCLVLNRW
jgi:hypothetical protein